MENQIRGRPPTHGARSVNVAAKFSDRRTERGKALHEALKALVEHFGGPEAVSAPMTMLIDSSIRPKLIVLMLIAEWVDQQTNVVNAAGGMPPVLDRNYLAYTNSLRLDLLALSQIAKESGQNIKPPSIASLIAGEPK